MRSPRRATRCRPCSRRRCRCTGRWAGNWPAPGTPWSTPPRPLPHVVRPAAAVSEAGSPPAPALRRAGPADAGAVIAALSRVHEAARDCGPVTRDAATVAEWLAGPDLYAYLAEDGFLAYQWHNGNPEMYLGRAEAVS